MLPAEPEASLAIRAVWLHYVGGLTQAAVAERLGIPAVKAHRLIARAVADGIVRISIDADIVECVDLETRLRTSYGLDYCEVTPDLGENGLPARALGLAGANFLRREVERGGHDTIGVGHGRTLAAAVERLPRFANNGVRFVSLLGGLTRNYSANPYDVMHRLAERTAAQAYVMPVPFFVNSAQDRKVLLAQRAVREVFDMAQQASLKFVGIGTVSPEAQLVLSGMVRCADIEAVMAQGGVAELLGHFFDAHGRSVGRALTGHILAAPLGRPRSHRVVAIAGGGEKVAAIAAVLRSGHLSGLITDECSARVLLAPPYTPV